MLLIIISKLSILVWVKQGSWLLVIVPLTMSCDFIYDFTFIWTDLNYKKDFDWFFICWSSHGILLQTRLLNILLIISSNNYHFLVLFEFKFQVPLNLEQSLWEPVFPFMFYSSCFAQSAAVWSGVVELGIVWRFDDVLDFIVSGAKYPPR